MSLSDNIEIILFFVRIVITILISLILVYNLMIKKKQGTIKIIGLIFICIILGFTFYCILGQFNLLPQEVYDKCDPNLVNKSVALSNRCCEERDMKSPVSWLYGARDCNLYLEDLT